jgi:hypothetical protein
MLVRVVGVVGGVARIGGFFLSGFDTQWNERLMIALAGLLILTVLFGCRVLSLPPQLLQNDMRWR